MASRSICTEKLRSLLDAIQADHPRWDGFSQSLADIFKERQIDPKATYARFYSAKEPLLVISYTWRNTSLHQLANICDGADWEYGRDVFGKPLHLGKTTWIDVLFTPQFDLDTTSETSALIVQLTAERYGAAWEHLVVLVSSFLLRAWCLAELAVTTSTDGIRITVVGEWTAVAAGLAGAEDGFYARMEAGQAGDVALVRAFAVSRFGSAAAFDAAVRDGVVGKLRAATLYNEACYHYYGTPSKGIAEDKSAGRALFEEAAALGHAGAAFKVGQCYNLGKGGLAEDRMEAARWFRRAADGGSADGQGALAGFYRCGLGGLPKDRAAAARLYSLAADQGEGDALVRLGQMIEKGGRGVETDAGRAIELYRLALLYVPKSSPQDRDCMAGLERLGASAASSGEAVRLEAARLARLDAVRRGGRTPAHLVALALAGGPDWDSFAQELAAAAAAAARAESDDPTAAAAVAVSGLDGGETEAESARAGVEVKAVTPSPKAEAASPELVRARAEAEAELARARTEVETRARAEAIAESRAREAELALARVEAELARARAEIERLRAEQASQSACCRVS